MIWFFSMVTPEYAAREAFYYRALNSATDILVHPDLVTPDHPYVSKFEDMLHYSSIGLVDVNNGMIYTTETLIKGSVVIVPTLETDVRRASNRKLELSFIENMCKDRNTEITEDITVLKDFSALTTTSTRLVNPVLILAYWLTDKPPANLGVTLLHELDHAYWLMNWVRMMKKYPGTKSDGVAELEVSAYRLEKQLFLAIEPEMYQQEVKRVHKEFKGSDFSTIYQPREKDKTRKSIRVTAFVNFLLDEMGAQVGQVASDELTNALRSQKLI
jgi:hypothetical protein